MLGLTVALGVFTPHALFYLTFIAAGLLGALVASREPRNSIGWIMCAASLAAIWLYLPFDYGYAARVVEHDAWPLGGLALWLAAWAWAPVLGLFLPPITVRFPDGARPARWRAVDWLAIAGTATTIVGIGLAPPDVLLPLLPLDPARHQVTASSISSPLGHPLPHGLATTVIAVGLGLFFLAYVASVASVVDRFRHARGNERLQLKWFAYAPVLIAVTPVYGALALVIGVVPANDIEVVGHLSLFALPLAIGIAILRYHLYDIDLIINRTLVYGGLTAILAAVYAAAVTLLNRLFISVSGQKSDAAYVLTAFAVVVASSPVKDWLQREVDRRISHRSPSAVLDRFNADVESVVSVIDVHRVARRLLDEAVAAFDARGAALYLSSSHGPTPAYARGHINGKSGMEVALRYEDQHLGRLVLGSRRGDLSYTEHDRAALQRSADWVGEALALAEHLGFRPLPRSRSGSQSGVR